ncbi:hypothetical protein M2168_003513 [Streptomyces sp. CZ24]|nr:hypothetical protein [Streptomyces sp. CZ24]
MPDQRLDLAAQGGDERGPRRLVGDGLDEAAREVGVLREDQGLLGREVREERGDGDVRLGGHLADAHCLVAALQEEPQGGLGDLLSGRGLLACAASGRLGHGPYAISHENVTVQKS